MERAGFIGMRRNIRILVKNNPPPKTRGVLLQPSQHSVHTSEQSMGEGEQKTPGKPGKLELKRANVEGYIRSCGGLTWAHGVTAEKAQELVDVSDDVSVKDQLGWSFLHYAAHSRPLESVKRLLKLHADPNAVNCLERTPLHQAVMRDEADIVSELLMYGANPNARDIDGWTPVHFAVHLGCLKTLMALMPYNPDFTLLNKSYKSPRDLAPDLTFYHLIIFLETRANDHSCPSLDSTGTSDSGLSDHHHDLTTHGKTEAKQYGALRDSSHTIVRAQRPNEESGAIVSPHPKSAYS
jgi:ankyrin repeat protein